MKKNFVFLKKNSIKYIFFAFLLYCIIWKINLLIQLSVRSILFLSTISFFKNAIVQHYFLSSRTWKILKHSTFNLFFLYKVFFHAFIKLFIQFIYFNLLNVEQPFWSNYFQSSFAKLNLNKIMVVYFFIFCKLKCIIFSLIYGCTLKDHST